MRQAFAGVYGWLVCGRALLGRQGALLVGKINDRRRPAATVARASDLPDANEVRAGSPVVAAVSTTSGKDTPAVRASGSCAVSARGGLEQNLAAEVATRGFHKALAVPACGPAGLRPIDAPVLFRANVLRWWRGRLILLLLLFLPLLAS